MNKTIASFGLLIEKIENSKVPIGNFILSFLFIIFIRCFLELISSSCFFPLSTALHFGVFTISVCITLIAVISIFSHSPVRMVAKLVMTGFIILIFPPIFDLILNLGNKTVMGYDLLQIEKNPILSFFTFFGSYSRIGITPGIKIELSVVLFFGFLYFKFKTNFVKAMLSVFVMYIVLFFYLSTPYWLMIFYRLFGLSIDYPFHDIDWDLIYFYSFLCLLMLCVVFFKLNKKYFFEIIKDMRFERTMHFLLIFILGIVIARKILFSSFVYNTASFWGGIFSLASIIFAWLFSVVSNNMADIKIDTISNPNRPSVSRAIPIGKYKLISSLLLYLSLFTSLIVSWKLLFIISIFIGSYYLYSMPPFRFKRIPLFSKLFIGFNTLIILIFGYEYYSLFSLAIAEPHTINLFLVNFPASLYAIFLIGFSLCSNFIDLKDFEGDKFAGIITLPGLLGIKLAKIIIGLLFLLLYLLLYFEVPELPYFIPLSMIGLFQAYAFLRSKFNEKLIFYSYLLSLIIVIIYFYNGKTF